MDRISQSVAKRVVLKAFLASDHISPATGKTIAVVISKNGAAFGNPNAGATNATGIASGWYYVDLDTTDTGTVGPLIVRGTEGTIDDTEIAFSVEANASVDVASIANGAITAAAIATGAIDADALASDAVTEIWGKAVTEPTGEPAATGTVLEILAWLLALSANPVIQTDDTQTLRNRADSTDIAAATVSIVSGVSTTRGAFV
jgi:hypothetical protein